MKKKEIAVPCLLHIHATEGMSYESVCLETLWGCVKLRLMIGR